MKNRGEVFGVLFVVMFLLLTAWGNALAMAVISGIGCVLTLAVLAWRTRGWRTVAERVALMLGCAPVAAIAALTIPSQSHCGIGNK